MVNARCSPYDFIYSMVCGVIVFAVKNNLLRESDVIDYLQMNRNASI